MMNEIFESVKAKMEKVLGRLETEFSSINAGRANPAVLDKIKINYYGTPTPVGQVATVSVPEPSIIAIQPWESNLVKDIEKAIQVSDIGINPINDGRTVRLCFPPLTEERRKEVVKKIHKYGEEAKIGVRNVRRDGMDKYKAEKKNSTITEDDFKDSEKKVQDLTDKYCKTIDEAVAKKEKEIMSL